MKNIKPIYIMHESIISLEKNAVLEGVKELLQIAEVEHLISIIDFGIWKHYDNSRKCYDYLNADGSLKEYCSIDWYLEEGRKIGLDNGRNQLNADKITDLFAVEQWREYEDHYDIMVTKQDIYAKNTNFLIGGAIPGYGALISTYRFKNLDDWLRYECIKTGTMHELGHVFEILPDRRKENIEDNLGTHCTNRCVMKQGNNVPEDWIDIIKDRLRYKALCNTCEKYLKNYFQ